MAHQKFLKSIICLAIILSPFAVFAAGDGAPDGIAINLGISMLSKTDDAGGGSNPTTLTYTPMSFGLFYQMGSGLYIGGAYDSDTYAITSSGTTTSQAFSGYGPMVGYNYHGFYVDAVYILSSTYTLSSSSTAKSGTGTQFDVGYNMYMGKFHLGPSIAMRSVSYTKATIGGVDGDLTNAYKLTTTMPYFNFGFTF